MSTKNPSQTPETKSGNAPAYTHWKDGVFAKIWRNENQKGDVFYNTQVGKIYTDPKTHQVRETNSLSQRDLSKMRFVLDQAENTITHMQNLQVQANHINPPIVQDHSDLKAQRDAALSQSKVPQQSAGNGHAPSHIQSPEM